jgi:hypothetical protein
LIDSLSVIVHSGEHLLVRFIYSQNHCPC